MRHALVWPSSKLWSPSALGEMPANLAGRKLGSAEPAAGIRRPGGRPRFALERRSLLFVCPLSAARCGEPRRSWSEIAGFFGPIVKWIRIWRSVRQAPQPQPHAICGPRGRPMRWNGLKIDSRTRLAHRRHRPEKHRSQNGYRANPS